jgi:heavy metal sensor kinase
MPSRLLTYLPSIRLSLMVYFLVLLGAALGMVSYLCYDATQDALAEKEASTRKLLQRQFEENKTNVHSEFDAKLADRARNLGAKAIYHQHRSDPLNVLTALGYIPNGSALPAFLPVVESLPGIVERSVPNQHPDIRIQSREGDTPYQPATVDEGRYFTTFLLIGKSLIPLETSQTLGGAAWTLESITKAKVDDRVQFYDELDLPSGKRVRRVAVSFLVATTVRGVIVGPPPKFEPKGPPLGGFGKFEPKSQLALFRVPLPADGELHAIREQWRPKMYMLYGEDTTRRDSAVAAWGDARDKNIANLTEELNESRAQLRRRLFWVAFGVFCVGLLGGLVLVHHSLSPLKRFSEAVSKVSERDFYLPLTSKPLPRELAPIAARLSQSLSQLKRAFDREKQAAADISHELRTPVAALLTTVEIALRKPRAANEYREVLEDCRFNGQQIHQLVERLLTLARLDAGADMLRPRDVDVKSLADQCVAMVRPLAEARGLHLRAQYSSSGSVVADPDKLREVLTNLLHNAIEYNKPEGSIDVKVERDNGTLQLEVTDTGIGITPEVRQHIFERFFRADPSRHSDSPHAGLGLAIVKGYVELMGGVIDVESAPGVGSTFRVRLPSNN